MPLYSKALQALRQSFVQAGLYSVGINMLMLVGPLYMLQIYDRVMLSGSVPTLMGLFAIVVVLYAFMALYETMRGRVLSRAAHRVDAIIAPAAFDRRLGTDAAHDNTLRDVDFLRSFLAGPAVRALFDAPWLPIFLVTVCLIHPLLGVLTLLGALVVVALAVLNHWVTKDPMAAASGKESQERAFIEQCRRGTETIQALGMRAAISNRWHAMHNAALASGQTGGDLGDTIASISRSFRLLLQAILLTGGAYLALNQQISMGMIVGASILAGRALAPIDQIIGQWRPILRALETHKRLQQNLGQASEAPAPLELPEIKGKLELVQVTKLVPNGEDKGRPRILEQVSFTLEPADGLCVMGNSASGKSSLARMLVGAWAPDAGQVRLDGATLDQWDPDTLGARIGYLPQTVTLFPGTIAENISRFDPSATGEEVFEATSIAKVHDMILKLPDGYSTMVGNGAVPLSGGQVQRIGLARALYKLPKLVVLDEPNAHLDTQGDEALIETVNALRARGVTVVMMTHRAGLINAANKMLILQHGRVMQFGDRDTVLQALRGGGDKSDKPSPPKTADKADKPDKAVKAPLPDKLQAHRHRQEKQRSQMPYQATLPTTDTQYGTKTHLDQPSAPASAEQRAV